MPIRPEIQAEIDLLMENYKPVNALIEVRRQLSIVYKSCVILNTMVTNYQTEDIFDTLPLETKAVFTRLYQIFNQTRLACEADEDFDILIK